MKITVEDDNGRVVSITAPVVDMQELQDLLVDMCLALGYHPKTVYNYIAPERLDE